MAVDLPAFERPANTISGTLAPGHSTMRDAEISKCVLWKLIVMRTF